MKNIHFRFISGLFVFVVLLTFGSCQKNKMSELNSIYKPNKEFVFISKLSSSDTKDTLILKTLDRNSTEGRKLIRWTYHLKNSKISGNAYSETDLTNKYDEISLPFPASDSLNITSLTLAPTVVLPLAIGYTKDYHKEIIKSSDGTMGLKIKIEMEVVGKTYYSNGIIKDSCWVIKTIARSSKDIINTKYYFSEKYGFVYLLWKSKSTNNTIEMKLIGTKQI